LGLGDSDGAQHALIAALELARIYGATLTLLSVEEHLPHYAASVGEVEETVQELNARFRQIQQAAVRQAAAQGLQVETLVVAGSAAQTITRTVQAEGVRSDRDRRRPARITLEWPARLHRRPNR
jgi:nucleotide-binding universal stress UspA family protein